jgi:quercetin dioxygenase-like cupin family protein
MTNMPGTLCVNPADETIAVGPLTIRFLVTAADSAGSVAVFEVDVPAGEKLAGPAPSHDAYDETIYGIDGVITFTVAGTRVEVGPNRSQASV